VEAVTNIVATAVPLARSDVDTDQIIPSGWLKRVERTGFGAGLFSEWRSDPGFVLNQPAYAGAPILVAGPNFGTGSSREHAVWALMDYGFQAVVSARFADIFRTNCTKAGLLPVEVDESVASALLDAITADATIVITIDVRARRLVAEGAGVDAAFAMDPFTQWRFLEGLDDIALTLRHGDAINTFEARRPAWMPVTS